MSSNELSNASLSRMQGIIAMLQTDKNQLTQKKIDLESQLVVMKNTVAKSNTRLDEMSISLDKITKERDSLLKERQNLLDTVTKLKNEAENDTAVVSLKSRLQGALTRVTELSEECSSLKNVLQHQTDRNKRLDEASKASVELISKLNVERDTLKKELESCKAQCSEIAARLSVDTEDLQQKLDKSEESRNKYASKLKEANESATMMIQKLMKEVEKERTNRSKDVLDFKKRIAILSFEKYFSKSRLYHLRKASNQWKQHALCETIHDVEKEMQVAEGNDDENSASASFISDLVKSMTDRSLPRPVSSSSDEYPLSMSVPSLTTLFSFSLLLRHVFAKYQNAQASSKLTSAEFSKLVSSLSTLKSEIEEKNAQLSQKDIEISKLQGDLEDEQAKVAQSRGIIDNFRESLRLTVADAQLFLEHKTNDALSREEERKLALDHLAWLSKEYSGPINALHSRSGNAMWHLVNSHTGGSSLGLEELSSTRSTRNLVSESVGGAYSNGPGAALIDPDTELSHHTGSRTLDSRLMRSPESVPVTPSTQSIANTNMLATRIRQLQRNSVFAFPPLDMQAPTAAPQPPRSPPMRSSSSPPTKKVSRPDDTPTQSLSLSEAANVAFEESLRGPSPPPSSARKRRSRSGGPSAATVALMHSLMSPRQNLDDVEDDENHNSPPAMGHVEPNYRDSHEREPSPNVKLAGIAASRISSSHLSLSSATVGGGLTLDADTLLANLAREQQRSALLLSELQQLRGALSTASSLADAAVPLIRALSASETALLAQLGEEQQRRGALQAITRRMRLLFPQETSAATKLVARTLQAAAKVHLVLPSQSTSISTTATNSTNSFANTQSVLDAYANGVRDQELGNGKVHLGVEPRRNIQLEESLVRETVAAQILQEFTETGASSTGAAVLSVMRSNEALDLQSARFKHLLDQQDQKGSINSSDSQISSMSLASMLLKSLSLFQGRLATQHEIVRLLEARAEQTSETNASLVTSLNAAEGSLRALQLRLNQQERDAAAAQADSEALLQGLAARAALAPRIEAAGAQALAKTKAALLKTASVESQLQQSQNELKITKRALEELEKRSWRLERTHYALVSSLGLNNCNEREDDRNKRNATPTRNSNGDELPHDSSMLSLISALAEEQKEHVRTRAALRTVRADLEASEQERRSLTTGMQNLRAELMSARAEALQAASQHALHKQALADAEAHSKELAAEVAALESRLLEATGDVSVGQTELADARKALEAERAALARMSTEMESLRFALREQEHSVWGLNDQADDSRESEHQLLQELDALRQQNADLRRAASLLSESASMSVNDEKIGPNKIPSSPEISTDNGTLNSLSRLPASLTTLSPVDDRTYHYFRSLRPAELLEPQLTSASIPTDVRAQLVRFVDEFVCLQASWACAAGLARSCAHTCIRSLTISEEQTRDLQDELDAVSGDLRRLEAAHDAAVRALAQETAISAALRVERISAVAENERMRALISAVAAVLVPGALSALSPLFSSSPSAPESPSPSKKGLVDSKSEGGKKEKGKEKAFSPLSSVTSNENDSPRARASAARNLVIPLTMVELAEVVGALNAIVSKETEEKKEEDSSITQIRTQLHRLAALTSSLAHQLPTGMRSPLSLQELLPGTSTTEELAVHVYAPEELQSMILLREELRVREAAAQAHADETQAVRALWEATTRQLEDAHANVEDLGCQLDSLRRAFFATLSQLNPHASRPRLLTFFGTWMAASSLISNLVPDDVLAEFSKLSDSRKNHFKSKEVWNKLLDATSQLDSSTLDAVQSSLTRVLSEDSLTTLIEQLQAVFSTHDHSFITDTIEAVTDRAIAAVDAGKRALQAAPPLPPSTKKKAGFDSSLKLDLASLGAGTPLAQSIHVIRETEEPNSASTTGGSPRSAFVSKYLIASPRNNAGSNSTVIENGSTHFHEDLSPRVAANLDFASPAVDEEELASYRSHFSNIRDEVHNRSEEIEIPSAHFDNQSSEQSISAGEPSSSSLRDAITPALLQRLSEDLHSLGTANSRVISANRSRSRSSSPDKSVAFDPTVSVVNIDHESRAKKMERLFLEAEALGQTMRRIQLKDPQSPPSFAASTASTREREVENRISRQKEQEKQKERDRVFRSLGISSSGSRSRSSSRSRSRSRSKSPKSSPPSPKAASTTTEELGEHTYESNQEILRLLNSTAPFLSPAELRELSVLEASVWGSQTPQRTVTTTEDTGLSELMEKAKSHMSLKNQKSSSTQNSTSSTNNIVQTLSSASELNKQMEDALVRTRVLNSELLAAGSIQKDPQELMILHDADLIVSNASKILNPPPSSNQVDSDMKIENLSQQNNLPTRNSNANSIRVGLRVPPPPPVRPPLSSRETPLSTTAAPADVQSRSHRSGNSLLTAISSISGDMSTSHSLDVSTVASSRSPNSAPPNSVVSHNSSLSLSTDNESDTRNDEEIVEGDSVSYTVRSFKTASSQQNLLTSGSYQSPEYANTPSSVRFHDDDINEGVDAVEEEFPKNQQFEQQSEPMLGKAGAAFTGSLSALLSPLPLPGSTRMIPPSPSSVATYTPVQNPPLNNTLNSSIGGTNIASNHRRSVSLPNSASQALFASPVGKPPLASIPEISGFSVNSVADVEQLEVPTLAAPPPVRRPAKSVGFSSHPNPAVKQENRIETAKALLEAVESNTVDMQVLSLESLLRLAKQEGFDVNLDALIAKK